MKVREVLILNSQLLLMLNFLQDKEIQIGFAIVHQLDFDFVKSKLAISNSAFIFPAQSAFVFDLFKIKNSHISFQT